MLRSRTLAPARVPAAFAIAVALTAGAPAGAQTGSGPLFPETFRVAHHLVQEDGDGSRFVGEPVVDTYGGSWIVSERPDGSRLIVDLVRRELSEVRADRGVYWTVSFDRFAELQRRLRAAQGLAPKPAEAEKKNAAGAATKAAAELVVTEVAAGDAKSLGGALSARPEVRHLRVTRSGDSNRQALEVWVDPSIRLTPAALAAVSSLEGDVLAGPAAESPGRYLAAARAHAKGALPLRTLRPAAPGMGQVEDVATKVERLERFPSELAQIPEGLRRVPHPLEATVRFLEEDAERSAAMAGTKQGEVND